MFDEARNKERDKKEVYNGTKALVELSQQKGKTAFIRVDDVKNRAGITKSGGSGGLWPWLGKEANVVEEQTRPKAYKIRKEFWDAMLQQFGSRPTA